MINSATYAQLAQANKTISTSPNPQLTTLTNTQPLVSSTATTTAATTAATITNNPAMTQAQYAQQAQCMPFFWWSFTLSFFISCTDLWFWNFVDIQLLMGYIIAVTNVNDLTSLVTSPFYNPAGSQREGNLFSFDCFFLKWTKFELLNWKFWRWCWCRTSRSEFVYLLCAPRMDWQRLGLVFQVKQELHLSFKSLTLWFNCKLISNFLLQSLW